MKTLLLVLVTLLGGKLGYGPAMILAVAAADATVTVLVIRKLAAQHWTLMRMRA